MNRKPIRWFTRPPWKPPAHIVVFDEVPGVASRDDDTELKILVAEAQLDSHNADLVIYNNCFTFAACKKKQPGIPTQKQREAAARSSSSSTT